MSTVDKISKILELGGIPVLLLNCERTFLEHFFEEFFVSKVIEEREILEFYQCKELSKPCCKYKIAELCISEDENYYYVWREDSDEVMLQTQKQGSHSLLYYTNSCSKYTRKGILGNWLAELLTRSGGFFLHGALIEYKGKGIIFTGNSGAGKSTQAELWRQYASAKIINGDKVIMNSSNQVWSGYGSPWSGSSAYVVNQSVPIKAIILVEQSKENYLVKLNDEEKAGFLATHVYYPLWSDELSAKCMDNVSRCLHKVAAYRLYCTADEEAVSTCLEGILKA